MQLPLRKSSAEAILNEYSAKIEAFIGDPQSEQSELLSELKALQEKCETFALAMFDALGFKEGNLQAREKAINEKIQAYQKDTFFLNDTGLNDFILKGLAQAGTYSHSLQQRYENFLYNTLEVTTQDELNKVPPEKFGEVLYPLLGQSLDGITFVVKDGSTQITAYRKNSDTGRFTGKGISLRQIFDFNSLNKSMRTKLDKVLTNSQYSSDGQQFSIEVTEENVYSLLNLKTSAYEAGSNFQGIYELLQSDPDVVNKVKQVLREKLEKIYKGNNIVAWVYALDEVLSKATPETLFAGKNAQKNITGLLGELQAVYYIKSLLPDADPWWIGGLTQQGQGKKPHADIIFQQYGIQVKNTSAEEAKRAIMFESFTTGKIESIRDIQWNKIVDDQYTKIATQDSNLFDAATQLLGLEFFNVPYKWNDSTHMAEKKPIEEVQEFADVRNRIIEAAEKARQALAYFLAGMMHMQFQPSQNPQDANTLYIIGGTLAITGASILLDVIEQIKLNVQQFDFSIKAVKLKENQKTNNFKDIVDFFNMNKYDRKNTTKLILQSSYNFFKE